MSRGELRSSPREAHRHDEATAAPSRPAAASAGSASAIASPGRGHVLGQLAVGCLILVLALRGVGMHELAALLWRAAATHPWVMAGALALQLLAATLNGLKWYGLLRASGLEVRPAQVLHAYFLGYFLNNLFTGLGEVERVRSVGAATGQVAAVLVTVVLERWCGIAALASLSLLGTSLAARQVPGLQAIALLQGGGLLVLVGLLAAALRSSEGLPAEAEPGTSPWERWRLAVARARATLRTLERSRGWLVRALGLSLASGVLGIATHAALAWSLDPPPASWLFLLTTPLAGALGQAPVSFNGLGIQEAAYRALFTASGLTVEAALALSLLAHGMKLGVGLGGGLWALLQPSSPGSPFPAQHPPAWPETGSQSGAEASPDLMS